MRTRRLYTTFLALAFVTSSELRPATCEEIDQSTQIMPFDRLAEAVQEDCFDQGGWIPDDLAVLADLMKTEPKSQEALDQRSLVLLARMRGEISQQATARNGL
jgi:hypothetical protein